MNSFLNFEPVHFSMSGSNCCFLTSIQVLQEAGKVVWYPHVFKNFPQFVVIHTVTGFSVVQEAEMDVFSGIILFSLWPNRCWQFDLWFLSAFSKSSLYIGKFLVHVVLKPSLKDFERYLASLWNEQNCAKMKVKGERERYIQLNAEFHNSKERWESLFSE